MAGFSGIALYAEDFAFEWTEVESAVVAHKMSDGLELAFDKGFIVADDGNAEGGDLL